MLKDENVELAQGGRPNADSLTYQTAQKDIFVGGDVYTDPSLNTPHAIATKRGS